MSDFRAIPLAHLADIAQSAHVFLASRGLRSGREAKDLEKLLRSVYLQALETASDLKAETERLLAEEREKYYVKARVYGAIAARFGKALERIAAPGTVNGMHIAKDALEWRHSEKGGVPRTATAVIDELLRAEARANELECEVGKLRAVAEAARELTGWEWLHLLSDDLPSRDVRADVERLDGALAALDGKDGERPAVVQVPALPVDLDDEAIVEKAIAESAQGEDGAQ